MIDLDWSHVGSSTCVIIMHGLEGHSQRPYVRGMARACNRAGWDVVAVNMRGCGGEPNLLPKSYHNGSSDDLDEVINHVTTLSYACIKLIGFSLGGNVILKYLGEGGWNYPSTLSSAVAISPPCHLTSCAEKLTATENRIYMRRFLKMLHKKILAKKPLFPDQFNDDNYSSITTFKQFDDRYTAPLHGFSCAEDYWERASSLQFLPFIKLPTLILSSSDDPLLTPQCFPQDIAEKHATLTLEITRYGGHTGFYGQTRDGLYWHEQRAIAFLDQDL
jgi:predicted alpha/beta-fold hydrolase